MATQALSSILQKNLFRWFFVPSLALLLLFGAFTTWRLAAKEQERNVLLAASLSKYIQTYVETSLGTLRQTAAMAETTSMMQAPGALRRVQASHPQFERLIWVTDRHRVLAVSPAGIVGSIYPMDTFGPDAGILSTPSISPETGTLVVRMAANVAGGGAIVGELSLAELQEYVNDFLPPGEGHVILLDTFGNLIAHPDMRLVRRQTNVGHQEFFRDASSGEQPAFLYRQDQQSHLASAARIPATDWLVVVSRPLHSLLQAVTFSLAGIAAVVLGLFLVMLHLLRRDLRRRVAEPMQQFTAAMARVSRGDHRDTIRNRDTFAELGTLREAYEHMSRTTTQREHELRLSEEKYRNIFNNSLEGIFQTDPRGGFISANPAAADLLGYDSPEALIHGVANVAEVYADPGERDEVLRRLTAGEAITDMDVAIRRKDGSVIWCRVSLRGVFENGDLQFIDGAAIDITPRRKAEEERNRFIAEIEEKNAELERFIYMVSHDLKSPLITIKGFLGILRTDLDAGKREEADTSIARIDNAATHMHALLEELLEFSRIGRLDNDAEEVPLTEVAHEALELIAGHVRSTGATVTVAPDLPVIIGDRPRLREVFQNLLENAVKFSREAENPTVSVDLKREGGQPVIMVRDNGIGIPEQFREKVFGIFEQLDPGLGGTGIGLALVRRIVENHGGTIRVCTPPGEPGTAFCMTLPGKAEQPPA